MTYRILLLMLFCSSIRLYCSQNTEIDIDLSEWIDISQESDDISQSLENNSRNYLDANSDFIELKNRVTKNFFQARTIIEELRNQLEDLNQNEEIYVPIKERFLSTTNLQIEKLNNLANLLETNHEPDNHDIDNSMHQQVYCDPKNDTLTSIFSSYVIRAEIIFTEICKTAQEFGIH